MAFTKATLENYSGSGGGPKHFGYKTTDTVATVIAAGYFNNAFTLLSAGDVIMVMEDQLPPLPLTVESITSGVVVVGGAAFTVAAGAGIAGIAEVFQQSVWREGATIHSRLIIDLTGLRSTASGDIIGDDGSSNVAHLGQITLARNGTLIAGRMSCGEAPAGGDPDIDLYSATEATGIEDGAISSLTETLLLNAGDWVIGEMQDLTTMPPADGYLYLVAGATTDADYSAGKLQIDLWGT